jgi:hypothetical protein
MCVRGMEMIKKIQIERFSVSSSKPFDQVVAALNAAIGHPDIAEFGRSRASLPTQSERIAIGQRPSMKITSPSRSFGSKEDSYGGT